MNDRRNILLVTNSTTPWKFYDRHKVLLLTLKNSFINKWFRYYSCKLLKLLSIWLTSIFWLREFINICVCRHEDVTIVLCVNLMRNKKFPPCTSNMTYKQSSCWFFQLIITIVSFYLSQTFRERKFINILNTSVCRHGDVAIVSVCHRSCCVIYERN